MITLKAPMHRSVAGDSRDVHTIKTALNHLGYYTPPPTIGIEDNIDRAMFDAVNQFQRDNSRPEGDHLMPHDATMKKLNEELAEKRKTDRYIWRTVGDSDVRDAHAAREDKIFLWGQPPEGGHPGQDFNCRCWAEAIKKDCSEKEIRLINISAQLFIANQDLKEAKGNVILIKEYVSQLEILLEKEKETNSDLHITGGVIGGAGGAVIGGAAGAVGGPLGVVGGAMIGFGEGLGIGSATLILGEEIADEVTGKISLPRLELKIAKFKKEIVGLQENIEKSLLLKLKKAQEAEKAAKLDYVRCLKGNKK